MLNKLKQLSKVLNLNEQSASDNHQIALFQQQNILNQLNEVEVVNILIDQDEENQQIEYVDLLFCFGPAYMNQLKEINLEIKILHLSDHVSFMIGQNLSQFINLKKINFTIFSDCFVGDTGLKNLCQSFDKVSHLEDLFFMIGENSEVISTGFNYLTRNLRHLTNLNQLNLIFLKNNKLTDEACIFLGEAISMQKQLKCLKLEIIRNCLSQIGSQAIHTSLKNLLFLEDFSYTVEQDESLGDKSLYELANSLSFQENLQNLSLNIVIKDISEKSLQKFRQSFLNINLLKTFKFFIQDENELNENQISLLIQAFSALQSILLLELHVGQTNFLHDKGCHLIQTWFSSMKNLEQLEIIIEAENFIGNEGLIALSNGIKHLEQLRVLFISIDDSFNQYNEDQFTDIAHKEIDVTSTEQLTQTITELQFIQELNLDINSVCSLNLISVILNKNIQFPNQVYLNHFQKLNFIKSYENQTEQSVQKLSFVVIPYRSIKQQGAKALSLGLQRITSLTSLSIQIGFANSIGSDGAQEISNALKKLQKLECLNLNFSYTKLNQSGALSIFEAIQQLELLKSLSLIIGEHNSIQKESIIELGNSLQRLKHLQFLRVTVNSGNSIKESGMKTFLESLSNLSNLNHVHLNLETDSLFLRKQQNYCDYFLNLPKLYSLSFKLKDQILSEINPKRKVKKLVNYQSKYQII
ncbi:hypothetical protein ABPG74_007616 [Tetrahymena malaccensis]